MWKIIDDKKRPANVNMAIDEMLYRSLLNVSDRNVSYLRFYGFDAVSYTVGVCQQVKRDESLNSIYASGAALVRRITGGGAVKHDCDLTYSVVTSIQNDTVFSDAATSYRAIHTLISDALSDLGVNARLSEKDDKSFMGTKQCFKSPVLNDIMITDSKVAGAAQKRSNGVLLHQGSIDLKEINELCPGLVDGEKLKEAIVKRLKVKADDVFEMGIDQSMEKQAELLCKAKYDREEWNLRH